MRLNYQLTILCYFLITVGCNSNNNSDTINTIPNELFASVPIFINDSLFNTYYNWTSGTVLISQDELTIEEIEIKKNFLQLTVSYFGGCQDHEFSLILGTWNTETIPPGLFSIFVQDVREDTCNTFMESEIIFDLSYINERFWYLKKYTDTVTIMIIIPGSDPPHTSFVYEFE